MGTKISALSPIIGTDLADDDQFVVVDTSLDVDRKIAKSELASVMGGGGGVLSGVDPPTDDLGADGGFYFQTNAGGDAVVAVWGPKASGAWPAFGQPIGGNIVKVDLGVVDVVALMDGPQTLYAMQPGEFLASVRFTDTDYVATTDAYAYMFVGVGTIKSFGWASFAAAYTNGQAPSATNKLDQFIDTLVLAHNGGAYDPAMAAGSLTVSQPTDGALVLAAAAGGDIQAALAWSDFTSWSAPAGAAWRVEFAPWQAAHTYPTPTDGAPTPGAFLSCVTAAGHFWYNNNASGTSGGSSPDFAGNLDGQIADGPDIVWFDLGAAPSGGTFHVEAEIWRPDPVAAGPNASLDSLNNVSGADSASLDQSLIFNGTNWTAALDPTGVPAGGTTGQLLAKFSNTTYDTAWVDRFSNLIVSGALPTQSFSSGTAAQVSTTRDVQVVTPVTFNSLISTAATCKVELSPDDTTYSTLVTETEPPGTVLAGTIRDVTVRVPAGWYLKLTVAQATLGISTYY